MSKIKIRELSGFLPLIALVLTLSFLATVRTPNYRFNSPLSTDLPIELIAEPKNDFPAQTTNVVPVTPKQQQQTQSPTTAHDTTIKYSEGIKVYGNYPTILSGINWGSIYIGVPKDHPITVSNTGDTPVKLSLSATNWTPGVEASITWDYDGKAVSPNSMVSITLSLVIKSANVTNFGNDIIISSTNS